MALGPLLARFKDRTAALHLEAERYVRILDRDASVDDYRRYLVAMHGFHVPLEQRFAEHAALAVAGFAAETRSKRAWLAADLDALRVADRPMCDRLPEINSLARAVGAAYVLEGSSLGGRFILAKLPPAIASLRGTATRFLDGYGGDTGAQWRRFATVAAQVDDEPAAVAAACDCFEHLIAWLARFERRALAEAS
jgi:heme oxygenase